MSGPESGSVSTEWRDQISQSRERIRPFVLETPLLPVPVLSRRFARDVRVKLENLQHTGSFKLRGAASRLTLMSPAERAKGVVACSSGNHGRAVAHMARALGIDAVICVPKWVDPVKASAIREAGARILAGAESYDEADRMAQNIAQEEGRTFVHPFDEISVVAGQGTIGLEIMEQCPEVAEIVVALSGGGLVSGVAAAVGGGGPSGPLVTAVTARNARVMWESLQVGRPIEMAEDETLAGALLGGIGLENRYTFQMVREMVGRHVLVSEDEIRDAIAICYNDLKCVVEGGGAVAVAALIAGRLTPREAAPDGPLVLVLGGGNLDPAVLNDLLTAPS